MDFGLIKSLGFWGPLVSADKKLTQANGSALPEVPLINSDVYWHEAQHPVSGAQLLGTFKIDEPIIFKVPIAVDTDIAVRTIGRNARGLRTVSQVSEANPDLILAGGLGGGSGVGAVRENHGWVYGVDPPAEKKLNFINAFKLRDDPTYEETDISTYGVPTGLLNLRTDKAASGLISVTTGTIAAATLQRVTLAARLDLQPGMGIYIEGAGPSGQPLITTVTLASENGLVLDLATPASQPVAARLVQGDDTAAVQSWLAARGDLAMPPGYYRLTSSIVVPQATEGFSVVIHGAGWDLSVFAFQHHGDGFIPTGTLRADSVVMRDLTIGTGTIGDPNGTIDAESQGMGLRMTAPSYSGIYNNFTLQNCRVIGWGRWGIWSDNLEVAWIENCIFRENGSGHVALVAPDDIETAKLPNANVLRSNAFDQAVSAGPTDAARRVAGTMASGDRVLTASGFTQADRGKFVIAYGAGTNNGTLYTFIDVVTNSTTVTLAHQAQVPFSGTVDIAAQNVASILLHQAHDTTIDGATIQGNFAASDLGPATNVASDVNAIRAYKCDNLRIVAVHEEDNAGPGGAACRLENCRNVTIENWGGASASPPNFDNAHQSDFKLIACHGVRVSQSYFNDRPQFDIDSQSSEVEIDNSWIVGYNNLWQSDRSPDRLRIGSGVRVQQSADRALTNQVAGNEYMYDSIFGRDLLVNGRFLDGIGGMDGWTADPTASAYWSRTANSLTRGGTFINIDATAQPDSTVAKTVLHQTVAVPDTTGPGQFTLAFDWNIDFQSGIEFAGYFVEVRLKPSSGIEEAIQFTARRFLFVIDTWQVAQIRCWLGAGTARTLDVQINVTPGVNNVAMHFANFRLSQGKHSWGAWERAVHDFGGTMRAPIEYVPIPAGSEGAGGAYPPPAAGSPKVSIVNVGGVLMIGANGAYAPIGTTTGSIVTGRQGYLPKFTISGGAAPTALSDTSSLHEDAATLYEAGHDFALDVGKKIYLGGAALPQSQAMTWSNAGTPPVLFIGTPSGAAEIIEFLTGAQTPVGTGRFYIDGNWSRLTWNAQASLVNQASDGAAFYLAPQDTDAGLWVVMPTATSGAPIVTFWNGAWRFGVDKFGNANIAGVVYAWPTALPAPPATNVYLQVDATGQLAWTTPAGLGGGGGDITGSGTASTLALFNAAKNITNSQITDTSIGGAIAYLLNGRDFVARRGPDADLAQVGFQTDVSFGASLAYWRYEHRAQASGGCIDALNNAGGEMQLFLNSSTECLALGAKRSWFLGALRVRMPDTLDVPFAVVAVGGLTNIFRVDYDGNLGLIRGWSYLWPNGHATANGMYLSSDTSGNLAWVTGGTGNVSVVNPPVDQAVGWLPRWKGNANILEKSAIQDRTYPAGVDSNGVSFPAGNGTVEIDCIQLLFKRIDATDISDFYMRTGAVNTAIWRFEHRNWVGDVSQGVEDSVNTDGEIHLCLITNGGAGGLATPNAVFGSHRSFFHHGLRIKPTSANFSSVGDAFQVIDYSGTIGFGVDQSGNFTFIRGKQYSWPVDRPAVNGYMLVCNTNGQMSWVVPPTVTGGGNVSTAGGTVATLAMFVTDSTHIGNSQVTDDGASLFVSARTLKIIGGGFDLVESWLQTSAGFGSNVGIWRYEHRSAAAGGCVDALNNTAGEMQLWLGSSSSSAMAATFGSKRAYFLGALRVKMPDTSDVPISVVQVGGSVNIFRVDYDGNVGVIRGWSYLWPNARPAAATGYFLTSDLSGNLSWAQATGASGANIQLSNLQETTLGDHSTTGVRINTWLYPAASADGTAANSYNFGSFSNLFNAAYFWSGVFVRPTGSSSGSPRAFGFSPSSPNTPGANSGQCSRFLVFADWNVVQAGDDARMQIAAYRSIELRGNRNAATAPLYTRQVSFSANDPSVLVIQENNIDALIVNSPGVSTTKFKLRLQENSADVLTVDPAGTIRNRGGTQHRSVEIQPNGAGQQTAVSAAWRSIIVDTYYGYHTLILPDARSNPGMIIDVIHMRSVQQILSPLSLPSTFVQGYDQPAYIRTNGFSGGGGFDVFNSWPTSQAQATQFLLAYPGTNGLPNPDNQHKMIRLIADESLAIWWLMPYYL